MSGGTVNGLPSKIPETPSNANVSSNSNAGQSEQISKTGAKDKNQMQDAKPLGFTHKVKQLASDFKEGAIKTAKRAKDSVVETASHASSKVGDKAGALKDKASLLGKSILGKKDNKELSPFEYVITDENVEVANPLTEKDSQRLNDLNERKNKLSNEFSATFQQLKNS